MKRTGAPGKKKGTPDSGAYTLTMFLAGLWLGRGQKLVIEDQPLAEMKGPYVLLANHESFEDFWYVSRMAHPRRPAYLANRYYCTRPVLKTLFRRMGVLPKRLFTREWSTGIGILRTIRSGYPLVIFPEGRLSPDGRTNPIPESGASLYRSLKADLVLVRIDGAYFAHPKWRKRAYRRAEIRIAVSRVLRAEELQRMSETEIEQAIEETLFNDASADRNRVWPQKDKAEGLENLLYRCTGCGALYQTKGTGNELICRSCGCRLRLDETYHFTEDPGSIPAYYDAIRRMEAEELDRLSLRAEVRTRIFGPHGERTRRETGVCTLTPECFTYASDSETFTIPAEEIPALAFSCGKEFELYHGEDLYYFYPTEHPAQAARWALAADLLAEKRRINAKRKGNGADDEKA